MDPLGAIKEYHLNTDSHSLPRKEHKPDGKAHAVNFHTHSRSSEERAANSSLLATNERCFEKQIPASQALYDSKEDGFQYRLPASHISFGSKEDDIQKRLPDSQAACGSNEEGFQNISPVTHTTSVANEEDIQNVLNYPQPHYADVVETVGKNLIATITAGNTNHANCYTNVEISRLHKEFKYVILDIENLDAYTMSFLKRAHIRLQDIKEQLEKSNPDHQLLVDVSEMITKVNTRLEGVAEPILAKNEDAILEIKNDASPEKHNDDAVKTKTEIPLIESNDINLLLIGSSGNGKSATGNSILRKFVFHTATGTSSNASISAKSSSNFKDVTITVVETRGVETNDKSKLEVLEMSLKSIQESLELCDYRFTALLIIIKFGVRFTQHESQTIKMIRGILGNDVIQKYGVCVVTHGDNFEYEMENEEEKVNIMTFEDWCRTQVGEIGAIFEECNFRCVLFNNRTKDKTKQDSQLEKLVEMIRHNEKYSKDQFLKAEEGLLKLTQELFLPDLLEKTIKIVNDIRSEMMKLNFSLDPKDSSIKATKMLEDLLQYMESIQAACWDESAKAKLLGVIEPLKIEITSKLKLCNYSIADKKKTHTKKSLQKSVSFDEDHFSNKHDREVKPTEDASKKEKMYSQAEIVRLEKIIRIKLDKLKKESRNVTNSSPSVVNALYQKIKQLKDEYSEFLSTAYGRRMFEEILHFQCNRQHERLTHESERNKWIDWGGALNSLTKIYNYFRK